MRSGSRTTAILAGLLGAWTLGGCGSAPRTQTPVAAAARPAPVLAVRLAEAERTMDAGEYDAALEMFRQILADNPTAAPAYIGVGEVYLARQEYARAEPVFARAARLEPRNYDAQYGHGLALQMLNRFVEAVRAYHRALTIRPESLEANHNVATTYLQMGEPRSALIFAEKAVALDPAYGPARANLGAVYEQTGRPADAIVQYEASIELMEATPQLLMNLVTVYGQAGRYVDARNTADYLVRIAPATDAYERLGWACFRMKDYEASLTAYREAVRLDGTNWRALNGIGCNALNKWLLSGKRDAAASREARAAFRRSVRVNPDQQKVIALLSQYGN